METVRDEKGRYVKGGFQVRTEEHKRKISLTLLGHSVSEESRQKISLTKQKNKERYKTWKGGICQARNYKRLSKEAYLKRKLFAKGFHTKQQWENLKRAYDYTCLSCLRKEPDIKLSEDHIVPLSRGGTDKIQNIQPLCMPCNSKKHTKIIRFTWYGAKKA